MNLCNRLTSLWSIFVSPGCCLFASFCSCFCLFEVTLCRFVLFCVSFLFFPLSRSFCVLMLLPCVSLWLHAVTFLVFVVVWNIFVFAWCVFFCFAPFCHFTCLCSHIVSHCSLLCLFVIILLSLCGRIWMFVIAPHPVVVILSFCSCLTCLSYLKRFFVILLSLCCYFVSLCGCLVSLCGLCFSFCSNFSSLCCLVFLCCCCCCCVSLCGLLMSWCCCIESLCGRFVSLWRHFKSLCGRLMSWCCCIVYIPVVWWCAGVTPSVNHPWIHLVSFVITKILLHLYLNVLICYQMLSLVYSDSSWKYLTSLLSHTSYLFFFSSLINQSTTCSMLFLHIFHGTANKS